MVFKPKISPEARAEIFSLAKEGMKATEIYRKLNKENKLPENYSVNSVRRYANMVYKPQIKRRDAAEVKSIESFATLCENMTEILVMLKKEYEDADDWEKIGHKQRFFKGEESGREPIFYFKRDKIRPEFAKLYRNFTDLIKTPASGAKTEVNVGVQNLQTAYDNMMKRKKGMKVAVANTN